MGHIVNPVSLKLGVTKFWNSSNMFTKVSYNYKYNLGLDYFIYKFLRGFFLLLLNMLYNFGKRRIRMGSSKKNIINTLFFDKPLRMLIGRVKILKYYKYLALFIYFWDGYSESYIRQWLSNIVSSLSVKEQFRELYKFYEFRFVTQAIVWFYLLKFYFILNFFQNLTKEELIKEIFLNLLNLINDSFNILNDNVIDISEIYLLKQHNLWLVNHMLYKFLTYFNMVILTNPYLVIWYQNNKGIEMNPLISKSAKKFFFFPKKIANIFLEQLKGNLRSLFFTIRARFYRKLCFLIYFLLESYFYKHLDLLFSFRHMHLFTLNVNIMGKYICSRLIQHFNLNETIFPVINDAKERDDIIGFHLTCSGRFSRKDKAIHKNVRLLKKSMNTFKGRLEYFSENVVLKNSVVGIKIWLAKKASVYSSKYLLLTFFSGFSLYKKIAYTTTLTVKKARLLL